MHWWLGRSITCAATCPPLSRSCGPAQSRLTQLEEPRGTRCYRTCLHPRKPAFRNSVSGWTALFAPKTTPKPIIDKLALALDRTLDDATTRKRLLELGSDIPDKTSRGPQRSS